jgi:hypothetical protein
MLEQIIQVTAALASLGTLIALIFLVIQVKHARTQIWSTSYQNLVSVNNDVNRMLFENPDVWEKLFPNGYCELKGDPRLIIAGIQILDLFDSIIVRKDTMINFPAWERFIRDMFNSSPYLKEMALKCGSHYTPKLMKYATSAKEE